MDKQIECIDCGQEFTFTEGEQDFYQEKGLYPPKRCKKCRSKKRAEKERSNFGGGNKYKPRYPKY